MDCRVKPGNDGGNRGTSVLHPFDRDLLLVIADGRRRNGFRRLEIAFGPRRDDMRDINRIASAAQKMIGISHRHKAFRMFRRGKDSAGIIDPHGIIGRGVEN